MESIAYGKKTSGAVFQQIIDDMLGDLQPQYAFAYIDNITIFTPLMEQHFIDLDKVFSKLKAVNLKVNIMKCQFARDKVKVFRHIVSQDGVFPDPVKVEAINRFFPPMDITSVKRFIGVINFFQKFIPDCAILAEPLIKLTHDKKLSKQITWSED